MQMTGHFLVDYGQAVLLQLAQAQQLDEQAIRAAASQLQQLIHHKDILSQIRITIPNSPAVNPSSGDSSDFVPKLAEEAIGSLQPGEVLCHLCGRRVHGEFVQSARKHVVSLLLGDINFYRGLDDGMQVCGLCRFAVLAAGVCAYPSYRKDHRSGKLVTQLIVYHTADESLLREIARDAVSSVSQLALLSAAGVAAPSRREQSEQQPIVAALRASHRRGHRHPITVWRFNSDNQSEKAWIEYDTIPGRVVNLVHQVMHRIEPSLNIQPGSFYQHLPSWVARVRSGYYQPQNSDEDEQEQKRDYSSWDPYKELGVRGFPFGLHRRWYSASSYMKEVAEMDEQVIARIGQFGRAVVRYVQDKKCSQNPIEWIDSIRHELSDVDKLIDLTDDLVRGGYISRDEAELLLLPYRERLLEYVKVAAVCYCHHELDGEPFHLVPLQPSQDEFVHQLQQLAERIVSQRGGKLARSLLLRTRETGNDKMIAIRRHYGWLASQGLLSFEEFVWLCPPDFSPDEAQNAQARYRAKSAFHYLRACLHDELRKLNIQFESDDDNDEEVDDEVNG